MTTTTMNSGRGDLVRASERAVLSVSLRSATAFEHAAAVLSATDFVEPKHEMIWRAIEWVNAQGTPTNPSVADVMLTASRLHATGELDSVGGATYLTSLLGESAQTANARRYAENVVSASRDRQLAIVGTRIMQAAATVTSDDDRDAVVAAAVVDLEEINKSNGTADPLAPLVNDLEETLGALEHGRGSAVRTGLVELDNILGGLVGGQVIVVGARPGVGKTVVAQAILEAVGGHQQRPAILFTLEMSRMEMLTRMIASACRIPSGSLNLAHPSMSDTDWERLSKNLQKVMDLKVHVCDDADLTPARMSAYIGEFKRRHPDLGVVIIDYAQLMRGDGHGKVSRQEEVSEISRQVKLMAKRHDVAIVLLSQLNRGSEQRADKRPVLSDLRESGAIEQDADVVILLHREDQYDPECPRAGEMDMIVEKHRGGPKGVAVVAAQLRYYHLANMSRASEPESSGGGW